MSLLRVEYLGVIRGAGCLPLELHGLTMAVWGRLDKLSEGSCWSDCDASKSQCLDSSWLVWQPRIFAMGGSQPRWRQRVLLWPGIVAQ